MLDGTPQFMEAMEKWLQAARAEDFETARHYAEDLVRAGGLLVNNPHFVQSFQQCYPGVEPIDALLHFCQFLVCATEGRAKVLKRFADAIAPRAARAR